MVSCTRPGLIEDPLRRQNLALEAGIRFHAVEASTRELTERAVNLNAWAEVRAQGLSQILGRHRDPEQPGIRLPRP